MREGRENGGAGHESDGGAFKAVVAERPEGNTTRSNTEAEKNTKTRCLVINNRSSSVQRAWASQSGCL